MATKKDEVMAPQAAPAYLANAGKEGLEDQLPVSQPTPRIKVVQAQSAKELREEFAVGTMLLQPDNVVIAPPRAKVVATPLLRWLSWQHQRDRKDQSGFWILEETLEPASRIAIKAKTFETRTEPYGDGSEMTYKFVECINFLVLIEDGECAGSPAVLTFSKGGHKYGANLERYLQRRNIPIYGNRLELWTDEVVNKNDDAWEQVLFGAPKSPFVPEGDVERLKALHLEFKQMYEAGAISVAAEE